MKPTIPLADREHVVYRMYDASDQLLYVGVTSNLRHRLSLHRSAKSPTAHFIPSVARITTEAFPNRQEGNEGERRAIVTRSSTSRSTTQSSTSSPTPC